MCSLIRDYNTKLYTTKTRLNANLKSNGEFLHLVDLDGAKSSKIVNYKILEQITANQQKLILVVD
jgi:phosphoribosylformimino-5-aminoimidazole carboxamide ribotide isomerase